ncbi:phosphotransferase family protein [Chitinophaga pinensis]|uniref:Aminoglycoside phosphotransferase n=1 Tax=Chitinophaga pinensis (strain ATCC 43595 / DSM 2588 / LMG 13176 / NBRC 15968 / NCIMB 11800 / UQM 2034) TaxID=485918 RepID=A0A979GUW4_CHIPD|nr:phosphotransferase [Chitinophaga pinensis]ACU60994.1 aminoglycoside phosphotransferase [Chitinophaga pinensis DSM 2588]
MSFQFQEVFPAERTAAINVAIETAFGGAKLEDVNLLTGGLSTAPVYKLTVDNRPYVMKLDVLHVAATVDLSEKVALAAQAGIAPALLYRNVESGITISDFVENKPIRSIFTGEVLADRLAGAVKKIHAVPYTIPGDDLKATIDHILTGFRQTNILSGEIPDECLRRYAEVREIYPWQDTDKVFSHNDLNPSNILCDGQDIWVIDWNTAFVNDRYVDLAGVANFFIHMPEQEAVFLKAYFGDELDEYKKARFYVMRQISRIIYALMMLHLAAKAKPADYKHDQDVAGVLLRDVGPAIGAGKLSLATYEGQFMYGKALMHEAVQQMRTARFEASLAMLKG